MTVLTLAEAEDLAARTLAAIDVRTPYPLSALLRARFAADRERVAADLEQLAEHAECGSGIGRCDDGGQGYERPPYGCSPGQYALGNLIRTAALYGVTP